MAISMDTLKVIGLTAATGAVLGASAGLVTESVRHRDSGSGYLWSAVGMGSIGFGVMGFNLAREGARGPLPAVLAGVGFLGAAALGTAGTLWVAKHTGWD